MLLSDLHSLLLLSTQDSALRTQRFFFRTQHSLEDFNMTNSLVFATLAMLLASQTPHPAGKQQFSVVESSIREMQAAMKEGRITSREIVLQYLTRIALYED